MICVSIFHFPCEITSSYSGHWQIMTSLVDGVRLASLREWEEILERQRIATLLVMIKGMVTYIRMALGCSIVSTAADAPDSDDQCGGQEHTIYGQDAAISTVSRILSNLDHRPLQAGCVQKITRSFICREIFSHFSRSYFHLWGFATLVVSLPEFWVFPSCRRYYLWESFPNICRTRPS